MRKKCIFILIIALMMAFVPSVYASSCSYEEQANLNRDVANIKVIYEEKTGIVDPSLYDCQSEDPECQSEYNYFEISILNMTEDFVISVKNNVDNTTENFSYADVVDGVIKFKWEGIMKVTTFTFDVESSPKTNCAGDKYRTIYLTTPRKNVYHYYGQCQENPEYYLCDKYVTFEEMEFSEFVTNMERYKAKQENPEQVENQDSVINDFKDIIKEHKILIISIGSFVLLCAIIGVVVVAKKRKKSVL